MKGNFSHCWREWLRKEYASANFSRIENETSGNIRVLGQTKAQWKKQGAKAFGQKIQYVFQDPVASLNPRKIIGETLSVPLKYLKQMTSPQRNRRLAEL